MIVIKSTAERRFPGTGFTLLKGDRNRWADDAEFRKLPHAVRVALEGMLRIGQISLEEVSEDEMRARDEAAAEAAKVAEEDAKHKAQADAKEAADSAKREAAEESDLAPELAAARASKRVAARIFG